MATSLRTFLSNTYVDSNQYRFDSHVAVILAVDGKLNTSSATLTQADVSIELILQQAIHHSKIKINMIVVARLPPFQLLFISSDNLPRWD